MKLVIAVLILIILPAMPVTASETLPGIGSYWDYPATSHSYSGVTTWNYNITSGAIVRVRHKISPGPGQPISISEKYIFRSGTITNKITCSSFFVAGSCDIDLEYLDRTVKYTDYGIALGDIDPPVVVASVTNNNTDGTFGFGINVQGDSCYLDIMKECEYYNSIPVHELSSTPIYKVNGTASQPIDIEFVTADNPTYARYSGDVQGAPATTEATWNTVSTLSDAVIQIVLIVVNNPILFFAIIEIFALVDALSSKTPIVWWKKWFEVHIKAVEWIAANIKTVAVVAAIAIAIKVMTLITSFKLF